MSAMTDVMKYFSMRIGEFRKEWAELTEQDKEDLKKGIADGTYTYIVDNNAIEGID